MPVSCASEAAAISTGQSAALGLIKHVIDVNAIAPGVVDAPDWEFVSLDFARRTGAAVGGTKRKVGESVPFGRMGRPEDHEGIAVLLASDDATCIVARTCGVDGGNRMAWGAARRGALARAAPAPHPAG